MQIAAWIIGILMVAGIAYWAFGKSSGTGTQSGTGGPQKPPNGTNPP